MHVEDLSGTIQYLMDLLGTFSFALSGAFLAVRKDFDLYALPVPSPPVLPRARRAPRPAPEAETVTLHVSDEPTVTFSGRRAEDRLRPAGRPGGR
ncbi:hypothetical protein GCM10009801_27020 [Streptomyces albiaxialis]|uniref:Uncharacterized protein n=1 Tax=Streptomyces albiaxialis TaxID=329523 RepID=A0ABN2VWY7_9ACTN